jgi:hypothetical protein
MEVDCMTEELKDNMIEILRTRNHDLVTDNAHLYTTLMKMEEQATERERYVKYLETIIEDHGWNPNNSKEHSC